MKRLLFVLAGIVLISSCSDDNKEVPYDFIIASDNVEVWREAFTTIIFEEGNGDYSFGITGDCIKAGLRKDFPDFGALDIEGVRLGTSYVDITDNIIGKTLRINVTVTEAALFIEYNDHVVVVNGAEEEELEQIMQQAEGHVLADPVFEKGIRYFSPRDGERFYSMKDNAIKTEYLFDHELADAQIYLKLRREDSETGRLLNIGYKSDYYYGYQIYAAFFKLSSATATTRLNMPPFRDYRLMVIEDITDMFRDRYENVTVSVHYLLTQSYGTMP